MSMPTSGTLWDLFWAVVYRAPVCRARLTQLQGGGSALSLSVVGKVLVGGVSCVCMWCRATSYNRH